MEYIFGGTEIVQFAKMVTHTRQESGTHRWGLHEACPLETRTGGLQSQEWPMDSYLKFPALL